MDRNEPYRYFIAYVFSNGSGVGNGWVDLILPKPIVCGADIELITQKIKDTNPGVTAVTVTGFQRFEQ